MVNFSDALLSLGSGAADVINKDAEADRAFMRKQKAKIAESRTVRQEKAYDKKKAEWDNVQKYGTGKVGQYMHAWNIFKDANQAAKAVADGTFAEHLQSIQDPGTFTPYEIAVTDEEVRKQIGDDSLAGKIMSKFGKVKSRRATQRSDQTAVLDARSAEVAADAKVLYGESNAIPGGSVLTADTNELLSPTQAAPGVVTDGSSELAPGASATVPSPVGESLFEIEVEHDFQKPAAFAVNGKTKMLTFDKATNQYYHGDVIIPVGEVQPLTEESKGEWERQRDRYQVLTNQGDLTPLEEQEMNSLRMKLSRVEHVVVRDEAGRETIKMFQIDPLTNEQIDLVDANKAPASVLANTPQELKSTAQSLVSITNMSAKGQGAMGIPNFKKVFTEMQTTDRDMLYSMVTSRAKIYESQGITKVRDVSIQRAMRDLAPAITEVPGTIYGTNFVFDFEKASEMAYAPILLEQQGSGIVTSPDVTETTQPSGEPVVAPTRAQLLEELRRRGLTPQ
jgi:hypothetical protein